MKTYSKKTDFTNQYWIENFVLILINIDLVDKRILLKLTFFHYIVFVCNKDMFLH